MDLKLGALLIISAQICTTLALPPCVCTRNLTPVCGSDGVTYANQCLLECAVHKTGNKITRARDGSCEGNDRRVCICTYEYKPVCGNNGLTYPNECEMDCQKSASPNLKISHQGECQKAKEPACVCAEISSPVCGSDGVTYENDCLLNCATKNNSMLRIAGVGACDQNLITVYKDLPVNE